MAGRYLAGTALATLLAGWAATPAGAVPAGSSMHMMGGYTIVTNTDLESWSAWDSIQARFVPTNATLYVTPEEDPTGSIWHSTTALVSLAFYADAGKWLDSVWAFGHTDMTSYGWNGGGCASVTFDFPGAQIAGSDPATNQVQNCGPIDWGNIHYGFVTETTYPPPGGLGLAVMNVTITNLAGFFGPGSATIYPVEVQITTIDGDNPGVPPANVPEPGSMATIGLGLLGLRLARRRA